MIFNTSENSDRIKLVTWLDSKDDKTVEIKIVNDVRSATLNNALHLWFELIAKALNDSGQYMRLDFFKPGAHVDWTKESVKEVFWRPLQVPMFNKTSSAKLTNGEACEVIEGVIRILGEVFSLTVEFPNRFWNYNKYRS